MKVIYKKPILHKIEDTVAQAQIEGKSIEKFVFTEEEYLELLDVFYSFGKVSGNIICGIPFEVED